MKATLSLNLPSLNLTKPVMTAIAQDILAIIKIRIYKGLDYNLNRFRAYSNKPIYISYKSTTYKRLKPKGGIKNIKRSLEKDQMLLKAKRRRLI